MKNNLRKKVLNILKYLAFFAIGVTIFMWAYRDYDFKNLGTELKSLNLWWLALSLCFSILSNLSRAIRWNMLLKPLGSNTNTLNSFIAVYIMYLVNLLIPRAGEVARCTVITKYQKTPFSKVIGTVVTERTTDAVAMLIVMFFVVIIFFSTFVSFVNANFTDFSLFDLITNPIIIFGFVGIVGIIILLFIFRKKIQQLSLYKKVEDVLKNIWQGILSIKDMEKKWIYIGHTAFIYFMWLLQLYVVFLAFGPTKHLPFSAAVFTLIMGTLAMFVPVNAGIGPYHFMVIQSLLLFGISETDGATFALIIHGFTNISLAFLAIIFSAMLPMLNKDKDVNTESINS